MADLAVSLWELGVKDMFPSLNRTSVYDAIIFIHDQIWGKLVHTRKARGDCMLFYINKFDKHLDRVGEGGVTPSSSDVFPSVMCRTL